MKIQKKNYLIIFVIFLSLLSCILGIKSNSLNVTNDKQITFRAFNSNDDFELTINSINFVNEIILDRSKKFNIYIKKDLIKSGNFLLTILGNSLTNFEISSFNGDFQEIDLPISKYFYNGYAIIINEECFKKISEIRLELHLLQLDIELIYIKARQISKRSQIVTSNNHIDVVLVKSILREECFSIKTNKENEYVFKFLTYTKNIKAIFQKDIVNSELFEINKESMTYNIKGNQYNEICFSLNENSEVSGSLSFEMLNLSLNTDKYYKDNNNIVIFNNFTLVRGLPSEHYLPRGCALVYKTDDYRFKEDINFMDIKFHMIQGNSKLFVKKCNNYPYCKYYIEELNENKEYKDINGYISVKKVLDEQEWKDNVAVVYCPEEENDFDCKFEISMKNDGEFTYLYKDQISYSFINSFSSSFVMEKYKIDLKNDFSENDKLYINFNIFSGNATIHFFDLKGNEIKDYQLLYLGNQIIYIFSKEFFKENLFIQIFCDNNAYFSILYEIKNNENINENYLEEGILQYGKISPNLKNNYIINNYSENDYYPYIVTINTFGNNIGIIDDYEKSVINYDSDFNLIQIIYKEKKDYYYHYFSIENNDYTSEDEGEDNRYLYNIISSKINTNIQMNNGQNYINQLNEKNKEASYVYFYTKRKENNNKLVINFRKFSKNPVILLINIIKNGYKYYIIKRPSKMILLNDNDIKNTCSYFEGDEGLNLCKITIKIKNKEDYEITEDISTHIDFSIQITGNDDPFKPIFLPQNIFISNLLIPNFTQIYFVEVPKYGIGKIYIDFMEGGGYAKAFLKNNRYNSLKEIYFDYFNKYFDILSNFTENCEKVDDCKIYLYLSTNIYFYKYNIYSTIKKNNEEMKAFFVPQYEYIYGNLKENEIHYYKTKISKETDKVIFNFYCDNCEIKMKYNDGEYLIDTAENNQFILNNKLLEKKINFYGSIIIFSIKIKEPKLTSEQNYNFRIIIPSINSPKIISIASIRNELCHIEKDSPCFFIIPIEKYNKIDNIRIFVPDNENANIFYKALNYQEYSEYSDEELISNIREYNTTYNIQKNFFQNKIERNNNDDFEQVYIIKIELNYSSKITVISSHYNIMDYTALNLQLNDYTLLKLDNVKKNITLFAYNKGIYDIEVNLIKGKGKINILDNSTKKYILDYKSQENINLLVYSDVNDKKELEAELFEGEDEFIIYIRVILTDYNNNLGHLNFQRNNYFNYLDFKEKTSIWPLHFYMKLNLSSDDLAFNHNLDLKNINVNYKLSNINDYQIKDYNEIFDIKIYLVNFTYINKKKLNPNEEILKDNLKSESNYRIDLTTGYTLIKAKDLIDNINNGYNYLYLIISPPKNFHNNNIKIMLSVFDLTANYFLPLNEYLLIQINQETKFNLGRKLESYNNSIIELVLDDNNFDFSIISQNNDNYKINDTSINGKNKDITYYGKTIINKIFLENEKNNFLFLFSNNIISNEIFSQNLLIKLRLSSNSNELNYFDLKDGDVIFYDKTNTISFNKIEGIFVIDKPIIIYNIKIYDYTNKTSNFTNNILNNEKPYKIIKYSNTELEMLNPIYIGDIPSGLFFLSILAEARNSKENIYEYFTYNPVTIYKISEETIVNINITKEEKFHEGKYSKSFIYKASIEEYKEEDYIKLSLKHKNYLEENNYIYASNEEFDKNSDNLYKNSGFKTIDRETSLIIPVNKIKNSLLYIKIPCNNVCNYTFYYVLYKKESMTINDDECFDFEIIDKQTFIYSLKNKYKKSLFTMTSYSIKDFNVSGTYNNEELPIDKTYFNGYSFIVNSMEYSDKDKIMFTIEGNLMIKICHRTLSKKYNNNDETYDNKNIIVGDKIYTRIENNKKECFQIYKKENDDFINYMISFISKTKNVNIDFYNYDDVPFDHLNIDEESDSIILNSFLNKFCISKNKNQENNTDNFNNSDAGIFIHLLSINRRNNINQTLNMPLIRGISTRQTIKKNQVIYYRINENDKKSNLINIHFQNITGNIKVYSSKCKDFPKCSFSVQNIPQETEKNIFNNNLYFNIKIVEEEKDIYHKSVFPVVILYCTNENEVQDFCNYYIEMSNDVDSITLNKNKKIYSIIQSNEEENNYKISLYKNDFIIKDNKKKLFIQIYSFIGSANILVNNIKHTEDDEIIENYYQYNNNTIFFIYNLNDSINEFNIKVQGKKNTYYNIFYYIINENNENERNIYLPSGEMHYSIITKSDLEYYYYFQDKKIKNMQNHYLITINPINCNLRVSKKEEQKSSEDKNQLIIDNNEEIKISYKYNLNRDDICEFTISAVAQVTHNRDLITFKSLIISDALYQNYNIDKDLKFNSASINYLIPKEDIKYRNILININKKTEVNLELEYKYSINNDVNIKSISNYYEILELNLKDINFQNDTPEEIYNFIILMIIIHVKNKGSQVIDFEIKINGNNLPSYLSSEEIEYGIINKENYIYYYFDYNRDEKFQIYFNCIGNADFKVEQNIEKNKKQKNNFDNNLYYNNKHNLPKENYFKDKSNYNYAYIEKCPYDICQAYIVIYISSNDKNNEKALFNIYKHSEQKIMNIPLNQIFYGIILNNLPNKFYSDINFIGQIKIVLNCKNCKMCYYNKEPRDQRELDKICDHPFEPSKDKYVLIENNYNNINKIYYAIFSDEDYKKVYFSIYIFNNINPKYINQNTPEFCETPCKLILPIYQFYYINKKNIILYVPDDEQTIIYEKIVPMDDNKNIKDFQLIKDNNNSSNSSLISNRLKIDFEEIKQKYNEDLYMEIQINSKLNEYEKKNITFITSYFYNSLNTELIPYSQNIFMNNDNNDKITDILKYSIKNNLYKIDINLIEGSGILLLKNNNDNSKYSLSYETQDKISLILKNNDINIETEINKDANNFIFYLSVNEKEDKDSFDELIFRKTNYLNYYSPNIFPIKLKLNLINCNDFHINLHFSKLIKKNNEIDTLINSTNEKFDIKIYTINKLNGKKELSGIAKYYCDLRRGYIHLNKTILANVNIIEIIIEKNMNNIYNYEKISLDVTPFDLNEKIELPRNNYLEMNINSQKQEMKLLKPLKEYKNMYIELSSDSDYHFFIQNADFIKNENIYGNNYYSIINDDKTEYNLTINTTNNLGTLFLKYIFRKDNQTQFNLKKSNINLTKIDNDNYIFNISHLNIRSEKKYNYNLSYIIRLYNSFNFENNRKPRNILIEEEPILSFRKELNEEELRQNSTNYIVKLGELLPNKYYISILGEAINDGIVDYFLYNYIEFDVKLMIADTKFDFTWLIIFFILLFTFIFATYFLIKVFIFMKNNKEEGGFFKNTNKRGLIFKL